ncbi:N-acetylmuramoyl-L-alanine amidase [Hoyosella sp. G463]|uniref:N-acetylmuramoyl-L-alanine amidase n=1 Tax=Lolliginicoccus lacisalsi TaxID=2742202 RepID=A0A927PMK2_9ACTN|nr:N-acetylmuramoyl-L-alanine amidase [Lolliginicoccus lacisalsi]MBD8506944.1 N-acetylmuramoyl-L-alanine amidase [Lolliginicoccus lacisalsi]
MQHEAGPALTRRAQSQIKGVTALPNHQPRRILTLGVTVGLTAAGTLLGLGATAGNVDITPVNDTTDHAPTMIDEVSLAPSPGEVTDISDHGEPIVREITQDTSFNMFGLTWEGDGDPEAFVRAKLEDDTWTEWFDLEPIDGGSDIGDESREASEVVFTGDTNTVQISIGGMVQPVLEGDTAPEEPLAPEEAAPTDAAAGEPTDISRPLISQPPAPERSGETENLTAIIIRPSKAPIADAPSDIAGNVTDIAGAPARPKVITRAQWGANEGIRCRAPQVNGGLGAVVVHHTAGNNNYTQAQSAQIVRGIYAYHAQTLGWCDVGYHALVDKYGQIFEGRFGGMDKDLQGAHSGGFNVNTAGYSMIGHYQNTAPPRAQVEALAKLAGWRLALEDLRPKDSSTHYSEGTQYTWLAQGQPIQLPQIFAHRAVNYTDCPGNLGYAQMDLIRDIATAYQDSAPAPTQPADPGPADPGPADPGPADPGNEDEGSGNEGGETPAGQPTEENEPQPQPDQAPAPRASWSSSELRATGENMQRLLASLRSTAAESTQFGDEEIARRWYTLGGVEGALGDAVSKIEAAAEGISFARFANGTIYWSERTGARAVWGVIGEQWEALGAQDSLLGLPTEEEFSTPEGVRVNFEHGHMLFDLATGEATVHINDSVPAAG